MGIFSRLRDIVTSNINSMLEIAEDPEKLLRLMIQEMEDTLVEIKAQCASAMAQAKTLARQAGEALEKADEWAGKATLAVQKQREDLAREALKEKRVHQERAEQLEKQKSEFCALIEQYQEDIRQLEEKMAAAREKQQVLLQRQAHAQARYKARTTGRKSETHGAFARFEGFERKVDRMEADADLADFGRKKSLEEEIAALKEDEELDKELAELKEKLGK
jgi:phage shock protein A